MMLQYRDNRRVITPETFGYSNGSNNFMFEYINNERNETVFPGKHVGMYWIIILGETII